MRIVHLSDWAQNADTRILCDQTWSVAMSELEDGIYTLDDGRIFTYEDENTTCEKCLEKMKNMEKIAHED